MAVPPDARSIVMQSILGPDHSALIPETLWLGWLDGAGDLIAMSGATVSHDAFGPSDDGVQNVTPLDCGVAGSGWVIEGVALFTDPAGESMLLTAQMDMPVEPVEDDALAFEVGALEFAIADPAEPEE